MNTAFIAVAAIALTLILTTFLAWRQRNEKRDLALLGALSGLSSTGAAVLWLD